MRFASTLTVATASAFGLVDAGAATAQSSRDVERPAFDVEMAGDTAELRRYAPMIQAEVRVQAENTDMAANMGFGPLASYIFGQNLPGEKIAMTAPVTTAPVRERQPIMGGDGAKIAMTAPVTTAPMTEEGIFAVTFTMPSEWTMDTLPAPQNDSISLVSLPERFVVVAGYIGPRSDEAIRDAELEVAAFIDANGLIPAGPFTLAGYSGPDVPPAEKEWEVHRQVAPPR